MKINANGKVFELNLDDQNRAQGLANAFRAILNSQGMRNASFEFRQFPVLTTDQEVQNLLDEVQRMGSGGNNNNNNNNFNQFQGNQFQGNKY
jgi:hypothetical protein